MIITLHRDVKFYFYKHSCRKYFQEIADVDIKLDVGVVITQAVQDTSQRCKTKCRYKQDYMRV